jgi:DNA-binding transcriptional LysR family regulator
MLAIVAHPSHTLTKRQKVSFAEAAEHDFVGFAETTSVGVLMRKVSADHGLQFKSQLQVTNFDTARRMVQAGLGVAVLPDLYASPNAKSMRLKCISLTDP